VREAGLLKRVGKQLRLIDTQHQQNRQIVKLTIYLYSANCFFPLVSLSMPIWASQFLKVAYWLPILPLAATSWQLLACKGITRTGRINLTDIKELCRNLSRLKVQLLGIEQSGCRI
jgi:hypothetical protein